MTAAPWPCYRCGSVGVRNVGARGYCGTHLAELLDSFDPIIWQANGIGLARGRMRPDLGPSIADLTCTACRAGWAAVPGTPCLFCRDERERLVRFQRQMLLTAPADEPTESAFMAWRHHLRLAVDAGLLTRDEASAAWRKAVKHVRAA